MNIEVGKKYQALSVHMEDSGLTVKGGKSTFVCSYVDADGDGWSPDLLYNGIDARDVVGWCFGGGDNLIDHKVWLAE